MMSTASESFCSVKQKKVTPASLRPFHNNYITQIPIFKNIYGIWNLLSKHLGHASLMTNKTMAGNNFSHNTLLNQSRSLATKFPVAIIIVPPGL
jgi:hypothetical protein